MHARPLVGRLTRALRRDLPFLHIITGSRQSGKTTAPPLGLVESAGAEGLDRELGRPVPVLSLRALELAGDAGGVRLGPGRDGAGARRPADGDRRQAGAPATCSGWRRAGSPKLIFWNDALVTAFAGGDFAAARADRPWWGRLAENAVGEHLLNGLDPATHRLFYWRERDREANFVVRGPRGAWALEVKSGADGVLRERPGEAVRVKAGGFPS